MLSFCCQLLNSLLYNSQPMAMRYDEIKQYDPKRINHPGHDAGEPLTAKQQWLFPHYFNSPFLFDVMPAHEMIHDAIDQDEENKRQIIIEVIFDQWINQHYCR